MICVLKNTTKIKNMINAKQIPFISIYLNRLDEILKEKSKIEGSDDRSKYPKYLEVSKVLDTYLVYHKLRTYCCELSFRLYNKAAKLNHDLKDFKYIDNIKEDIDNYLDEEYTIEIVAYWKLLPFLEKAYDDVNSMQRYIDRHYSTDFIDQHSLQVYDKRSNNIDNIKKRVLESLVYYYKKGDKTKRQKY